MISAAIVAKAEMFTSWDWQNRLKTCRKPFCYRLCGRCSGGLYNTSGMTESKQAMAYWKSKKIDKYITFIEYISITKYKDKHILNKKGV